MFTSNLLGHRMSKEEGGNPWPVQLFSPWSFCPKHAGCVLHTEGRKQEEEGLTSGMFLMSRDEKSKACALWVKAKSHRCCEQEELLRQPA